MSLTCAHNTFKISNINRKEKMIPGKGGHILEMLMNIGILNYTFFYTFNKCIIPDIFDINEISSDYYDDCKGYNEADDVFEDNNIRTANQKIVAKIDILLRKLMEYNNMLFYIRFHESIYGHALGFFTCEGRPIYYDNNGIDDLRTSTKTDGEFPTHRTTVELDIKQIFIEVLTKIKRIFESGTINIVSLKRQLGIFKDKFIVDLISPPIIKHCETIYPNIFTKYTDTAYFSNLIFFNMEDINISSITNYSNTAMYQEIYNHLQNQHYSMTSSLLEYYQEEFNNTDRIAQFKAAVLRGLELTERVVADESLENINKNFTDEEMYSSSESESDDDDYMSTDDEDEDDDNMSVDEA